MLFLLTNDDGIEAPGLLALERAVAALGDVVVVAPDGIRSGYSHQATTEQSLEIKECGSNRFSCSGTPVDCVRVALLQMDLAPTWVLSGINQGANLGVDIYMSGTAAAAREAAVYGIAAFAFSQYHRPSSVIDWQLSSDGCRKLFLAYRDKALQQGSFWNVNFPDQNLPAKWSGSERPPICDVAPDPSPLPVAYSSESGLLQYQNDYHQRPSVAGRDVETCFKGSISVSKIDLFSTGS